MQEHMANLVVLGMHLDTHKNTESQCMVTPEPSVQMYMYIRGGVSYLL